VTPLESILEIKAAVHEMARELLSRDPAIYEKAQVKYEVLVNRFFEENEKYLAPQQKDPCIYDVVFFARLIESAIEFYSKQQ